jgi:hypothetical protein
MCLAPERDWCPVTTTSGHLGEPGAGGVDRLVGRRRRCRCHRGGCVADAPLFQTSSRYVLVLISFLKVRKLTCLDISKNIFDKFIYFM